MTTISAVAVEAKLGLWLHRGLNHMHDTLLLMGRGDYRTRKGKVRPAFICSAAYSFHGQCSGSVLLQIFRGSFGKVRPPSWPLL